MIGIRKEVFDRHGRALVYLSDGHEMYNLSLVKAGHAIPYFIYPNAVQPTEDGDWDNSRNSQPSLDYSGLRYLLLISSIFPAPSIKSPDEISAGIVACAWGFARSIILLSSATS